MAYIKKLKNYFDIRRRTLTFETAKVLIVMVISFYSPVTMAEWEHK